MGNDSYEKVGTWVKKSDFHIGEEKVPTGTLGRIKSNDRHSTMYPYKITWLNYSHITEPYSDMEFYVVTPTEEEFVLWSLEVMKQ